MRTWLYSQLPETLLIIGACFGVALVCLAILAHMRWHLAHAQVRCFLGFHDDQYVDCMDACHCWRCGRRTPSHLVALLPPHLRGGVA